MSDRSFTTTMTVENSAEEVFDAINHPDTWWSETIAGRADEIGSEFVHDVPGVAHWKFQVTELDAPRKVVWRVLDDSSTDFVRDRTEWNDTEVRFEIAEDDGGTLVRFTHAGLVPEFECFEACSLGWSRYIRDSLHDYITTGKGQPGAY